MKKISLGTLAALLTFALTARAQTLELSTEVYVVDEAAGTVTLTVLKNGAAAGPISVHYATSDGFSATAPGDYTNTSGDLTFAPNETSKQFTVPIVDDAVYEGSENFKVTLSNTTG